jgi:hypothetical protein
VAALGTETKRQNPARVEARAAWEVKGWLGAVWIQPAKEQKGKIFAICQKWQKFCH